MMVPNGLATPDDRFKGSWSRLNHQFRGSQAIPLTTRVNRPPSMSL
jgi:hypothetical protein